MLLYEQKIKIPIKYHNIYIVRGVQEVTCFTKISMIILIVIDELFSRTIVKTLEVKFE